MPIDTTHALALRERAEGLASKKFADLHDRLEEMTPAGIQQALHELGVHQIELELQNEELRRAQLAVEVSRAQYFDLYDLAPVSYCTVSDSGMISQANLTTATLLGLPRGALLNRLFVRHILTADHGIFLALRKNLATAMRPLTCELRMLKHGGGHFWAHITATKLAEDGSPPVLRLVMLDISERKRSEEEARMNRYLIKSEAFARDIIDSVPAEIAVLDRNGVVLAVNLAWRYFARENSGAPAQAVSLTDVGTNYLAPGAINAIPASEADSSAINQGIRNVLSGAADRYTVDYPCGAAAQVRWFSLTATPLGITREGAVIVHTDITQRKKAEAEMIVARAEAEQANNAKSRFLAAASHDLRQPLSALSLYVGVLKNRAAPEIATLVNRIQDCSDSLSELLTDLLDMSKLDAGVVLPRLSDFGIDEFLKGIGSVFMAEASAKGLRLHVRGGAGIVTRTDAHLLGRVVRNLVANAIRYTQTGGVLIACRAHAGVHWIEVWDTGMGIPADKTTVIFEEFTQLGDELPSRGSGLGLAIVSKASALLGLPLRLRSRPGRGSMFAIKIPSWQAAVPGADGSVAQMVTAQRALRIGVVEDNAELRQAMVLALESLGHAVIAAENGKKLLQHLADLAPDVVVSDFRLAGGKTGFQVIDAARKAFGADLPAIIVTGDTDPTIIRSMVDRGIAVHFKPLQIAMLQAFITQAIERRAP